MEKNQGITVGEGHCPSRYVGKLSIKSGENMELPKRKSPRIPGYDYAQKNYYFITICTKDKKCIFGRPYALSDFGAIAQACLEKISEFYPQFAVDKYVVMPNHVHMILISGITQSEAPAVSVTKVVGQYKMAVTKQIHTTAPNMEVWQRSFHDHIIRNQSGYEKIWQYIENNPLKWEDDCFYCNESER